MLPRPLRRSPSSCKSARPTASSRKAERPLPRNKYVEIRAGEARHAKEEANATGVQDVQVHHRSHRVRRHRQGRNAEGLHGANLPGASSQEAQQSGRCQAGRPSRRSAAARRRDCQHDRHPHPCRHRRSRSGAVDETRLAFRGGAVGIVAGRKPSGVVARQHGIKKAKDSDSIGKLFAAYLRRAEESALGGLLVEITILHAATRQNAAQVLRDAATAYKVDVDAIGLKVKQEFAAKEKARLTKKPPTKAVAKAQTKPAKKAKAA